MNRQRWIDAFFRERLERREFPVEVGEFDAVRSLIHKSNSASAGVRGVGLSKWWLSVLVPVAGGLWWALGVMSSDADRSIGSVPEMRSQTKERSLDLHDRDATNGFYLGTTLDLVAQAASGSMSAASYDTSLNRGVSSPNGASRYAEVGVAVADRSSDAGRTFAVDQGAATNVSRKIGHAEDRNSERIELRNEAHREQGRDLAIATGGAGIRQMFEQGSHSRLESRTARNEGNVRAAIEPAGDARTLLTNSDARAAGYDGTIPNGPIDEGKTRHERDLFDSDRTDAKPDMSGVSVTAQNGHLVHAEEVRVADTSEDPALSSSRVLSAVDPKLVGKPESASEGLASNKDHRGGIDVMDTRWSMPAQPEAPMPVYREITEFKLLASGELHGFGAPLAVRARSGGQRSDLQNGLLFGVEYRVRTKRFSWATGIYYGSYAVKADQGETDVSLAYVELPLLASYKLGRGRFGIQVQGGISIDLLFNANGRYQPADNVLGAGFPEEAFQTTNFSLLFRPQAMYQMNERLSLMAGPLWKTQLGSVANDGPLDGAHIVSSGISFGLTWRLERTTY